MSEQLGLAEIQQALKAPKSQTNTFGNYSYRSCEDILTAVKPHLGELSVVMSDEMVLVGDRIYVKATASLMCGTAVIASAVGWAREAEQKKGMDSAQLTGACSSYARKYALNGLFAIDDAKDADSTDNTDSSNNHKVADDNKSWFNQEQFDEKIGSFLEQINSGNMTTQDIVKRLRITWILSKDMATQINNIKGSVR